MNEKSEIQPDAHRSEVTSGILKRSATIAVFVILIAVVLFLSSGLADWLWAWIYLGIYLVSLLINGSIMLRTSPETVAERARILETQDWDRVISGLLAFFMYLGIPLVSGLDVRFGWTHNIHLAWHIVGAIGLAVGLGFSAWAMIANAFFSTAVRIQVDRGHTVCSTGPYQFVRHPGYVGFILQDIAVPLLLGSWWALVPGVISMALIIARTSLEDRTLQSELPGYPDYMLKVHYRLFPGIW